MKNASHWVRTVRDHMTWVGELSDVIGWRTSAMCRMCDVWNRRVARFPVKPVFRGSRRARLPALRVRGGTSDCDVLRQIFIEQEYRLFDAESVRTIVDCGAYAGFSSAYFLTTYPDAQVFAIEPDPANVALCRQNLAPFGSRARVIQAAVWSSNRPLELRHDWLDGREWSSRVTEQAAAGGDAIRGIDLPTTITQTGWERIDLIKMDIEGAEIDVFGGPVEWLSRVRNLAIELHGPECEAVFFKALEPYRYERLRSGELTVCRNVRPR